jgi:diaminopimelate decarboxylase
MKNKLALYGNKYVNIKDSTIYLDECKTLDLVKKHRTPTFVFLENKIRANIKKIVRCFQSIFPNSAGYYSVKSNYLQKIVELVKDERFGAEILTLPELNLLKKIKFPMNSVLAGGPYLPDELLEQIIQNKIEYIVVYDLDDLDRINNQAKKENIIQKIIIRFLKPKYTGRQGISFTKVNIEKLQILLEKNKNLKYKGLLSHMGTQLNSLDIFQKNLRFLIKIAQEIQIKLNLTTDILNLGGGFPNADSFKEKHFKSILQELKRELAENQLEDCKIFYEPGRFVVGDCGFCLSKVSKYNEQYSTVFLDVGNNFIPKFMKSSLRFYNISKIEETPNKPMDFMGNIPSDQDILVKNYNFSPSTSKNDFILIANVGAYALTFSTRFPYPIPEIIMIKGQEIEILHKYNYDDDLSFH